MFTESELKEIAEQERLIEKYRFDSSFVRQCVLKIKGIRLEESKRVQNS